MMRTSATTIPSTTSIHPQHPSAPLSPSSQQQPHTLTTGASRAGQEDTGNAASTLNAANGSGEDGLSPTLTDQLKKPMTITPATKRTCTVQFVFGGLFRSQSEKHVRRASTGSIRHRQQQQQQQQQQSRSNSICVPSSPSHHGRSASENGAMLEKPTVPTIGNMNATTAAATSDDVLFSDRKEPASGGNLATLEQQAPPQRSDVMDDLTELEEELALCEDFDEDIEIREVPDDIITYFFSFLDSKELCTVGTVCKQWFELSNQQFLWEHLFNQRYPNPLLVNIHDEITHTLPLEKNHEVRAQQLWCDAKQKLNVRLSEARTHARSLTALPSKAPQSIRKSSDDASLTDEDISQLLLEGDYRTLYRLNKKRKTCCVSQIDPQTTLYRLEVQPFSEKRGHVYSEPFAAGKDKWRILVFPEGNRCQSLSIYLDVSADINSLEKDFKKPTIYMFIIMNRKQHSLTRMYYIEKNFSMQDRRGEVIDWGLQETLDLNTLRNTQGYLIDDSLAVMALLHVPDGPVVGTSRASS